MTHEEGVMRLKAIKFTEEQRVRMYDFMLQLKAHKNSEVLARMFERIGLTKKQRILLAEFLDDLSAEKAEG